MSRDMPGIYAPKARIAIASSFEGIVNDGARECALTALNAYHKQHPRAFFGRILSADEFNRLYVNTDTVKAFLALRPMVEVAEDYRTVLDLAIKYPKEAYALASNPNDVRAYTLFERRFNRLKQRTAKERDEFGRGKESLFYKEREALQRADYEAWLNTQSPFEDTLSQFRELVDTQTWDSDKPVSGFYPRFATSKDEASTHALCNFYARVKKLDPSDVESRKCLIPRDGIIGMETVPSRNKVKQLGVIADRLEVPRSQVWRVNDRYDTGQQNELYDAGFVYQFFLPGYAAPSEIEKAESDRMAKVLERKRFAEQLAAYAREWGF